MSNVAASAPQPNVIVVPPGGDGGGFGGRVVGALIASGLIALISYLSTYSTQAARFFLRTQGVDTVMPAEKTAKPKVGMSERARKFSIKLEEQWVKLKASASSAAAKGKATAAKLAKKGGEKVGEKTDQFKQLLAKRAEESKQKKEEAEQKLADERTAYDEKVRKYFEHYDGQCPRCHAPLRTKKFSSIKYVVCARCQSHFTAGRARALGPPPPTPLSILRCSSTTQNFARPTPLFRRGCQDDRRSCTRLLLSPRVVATFFLGVALVGVSRRSSHPVRQ